RRRVFVPRGRIRRRTHGRAGGFDVVGRQRAFAVSGLDDEIRDPRRMVLRRDGDFAHASPHGAIGVANRSAEHLGKRNERHTSRGGTRKESGRPNILTRPSFSTALRKGFFSLATLRKPLCREFLFYPGRSLSKPEGAVACVLRGSLTYRGPDHSQCSRSVMVMTAGIWSPAQKHVIRMRAGPERQEVWRHVIQRDVAADADAADRSFDDITHQPERERVN